MNIIDLARKLLDEINNMTELLYQNKEKQGYSMLDSVINNMQNLIAGVASYQQENGLKIVDEEKLLGAIGEAFQAMQQKDHVLFADIFTFIVVEQIKQLVVE